MTKTTSVGRKVTWARGLVSTCMVVGLGGCTGVIGDTHGQPGGGSTSTGSGTGPGGTTAGGTSTGSTGTGTGTGGTGTGGTTGTVTFTCQATTPQPGPSPMRLLTPDQYVNSIGDLLGDVTGLSAAFDDASDVGVFGLVQADIAQVDLERYQKAAELVAAATVANATQMKTLAPCATGADKRTCARTFVTTFGPRVYRAPVTDAADIERHLVLYDVGAPASYEHGIEMIIRAMLQAPRFIYRVEVGTAEAAGPNAVKLSPYEVASRLSYTVWNTTPDVKLTTVAASGMLATKEGIAAQLNAMIIDPRGTKVVRRFLDDWIHLSDVETVVKDTTLFPDWTGPTLRTAFEGQADSFFDYVLGSQKGSLAALLTSPTVFVNKSVGGYYGTAGTDAFQALDRTDGTASGILTLPALLATLSKPAESSPIYRGKFVREQLLCQLLPPPPPNVAKAPDTMPGVSTREKFRQHEADPACSGCHSLMDPVGLGLENYDAVGRYRTMDNGQPVDASGEVMQTADADGKFVGVVALGKKLAASSEVEACVARQWFRFFLSRFEQDVDDCSMKTILDGFRAANDDLNSLPLAVVQTDAFLYRRPIDKVSP